VTSWSLSRHMTSNRHARHNQHRSAVARASAANSDTAVDNDDDYDDDALSYLSLPVDVKPPGWILTKVVVVLVYVSVPCINRCYNCRQLDVPPLATDRSLLQRCAPGTACCVTYEVRTPY